MHIRWLVALIVAALAAFPALAQGEDSEVTFGNVSFSLPAALASNVNIVRFAGGEDTFPPEAPHTRFFLYNGFPAAPQGLFDQGVVLTVYRTADLAGNAEAEAALSQLQSLLAERPDLSPYMAYGDDMSAVSLPFLPAVAAGQVIRARAEYMDTRALRGVRYVTVYRQDVSPFTGGEFFHTFQGVSLDGQYYISAILNFDTTLFPAELQAFDPTTFDAPAYFNQSVTLLNGAGADAFSPALDSLDPVLESLTLLNMQDPAELPTATAPADASADPTLRGLAGTWRLVSYGPAGAPVAALANAPVTLTFAANGVSGSAGCNSFGGSFRYEGGTLAFGDLASTLMACEQPVMDQEAAFMAALRTASAFQIVNDQLQITYEGGALTFDKSA